MYFIPSPIIQKLPQKDEYYYGSIHHVYPYKLREAENICLYIDTVNGLFKTSVSANITISNPLYELYNDMIKNHNNKASTPTINEFKNLFIKFKVIDSNNCSKLTIVKMISADEYQRETMKTCNEYSFTQEVLL